MRDSYFLSEEKDQSEEGSVKDGNEEEEEKKEKS